MKAHSARSNQSATAGQSFDFLPTEKMAAMVDQLRADYLCAEEPYPHIVVDDFFDPEILNRILCKFSGVDGTLVWKHHATNYEDKFTSDGDTRLPGYTRTFLYHLNSKAFIEFIEQITGIMGLVADPEPGIHQVMRGGWLAVHADNMTHRKTKLARRINLFIYLNKDWKDEYNGQLELWDRDVQKCCKKISPIFNRTVIFPVTDLAYHGHPRPLACPETMSRKMLHVSYYSVGRPPDEKILDGPLFVSRPGEILGKNTKALAKKLLPQIISDILRSTRRRR